MKTAEERLKELGGVYEHLANEAQFDLMMIDAPLSDVIEAMKAYALEVAEAVREACIGDEPDLSELKRMNKLDLPTLIK